MNKTLWMCWFQGEDHSSIPSLNRECIKRWKELNSDWTVIVLSGKTIGQYVPEYFSITKECKVQRTRQAKSDLLRLLLLEKYGGVWADASLYPVIDLNSMMKDYLNETNFFAYRYTPRYVNDCGIKEIASFFLISPHKELYIIQKWKSEFVKRFISNSPNTKCMPINSIENFGKNNFEYQTVSSVISQLYDTDGKIQKTIDNMPQINEEHTHSFVEIKGKGRYLKKFYCHTYKRPNTNLMQQYLNSLSD